MIEELNETSEASEVANVNKRACSAEPIAGHSSKEVNSPLVVQNKSTKRIVKAKKKDVKEKQKEKEITEERIDRQKRSLSAEAK